MNMPPQFILALLLVSGSFLLAEDSATPAPAASPQTEMQKWIATTDEGWQAAFKRDVTDAHEAEVNKLKLQYITLLDEAVAKASKASDLDGAVALRGEQKRFSDTEFFPEQDEVGDAAVVKQVRATLRALLGQADKNRAARGKALLAKYDALLADAQAQLTKVQRLDDAVLVKKQREQVAAAWLIGGTAVPAANPAQAAQPAPRPAKEPPAPVPTQTSFPPKVPAKQPSAPANETAKADIIKVLVGTWHFHWTETGFDSDFVFKADGSFVEVKDSYAGKWTIGKDSILMESPKLPPKTISLPLDPAGSKVHDQRKNRHIVAVKKK